MEGRNHRPSKSTHFYLYEDERQQSDESVNLQPITLPKRQTRLEIGIPPPQRQPDQIRLESPVMTLKDQFNNKNDILKFPIESSHAYSYAHLLPNSLALRLNVLKRSLEILRDRPRLINSLNNQDPEQPIALSKTASNAGSVQSNASSAALAAYFRPLMKRSDSFPVQEIYAKKKSPPLKKKLPEIPYNQIYSNDLSEIVQLLEENDLNIAKNNDFTSTLHDLSLHQDDMLKYNSVKTRLMYALSVPFVDTSVMTTRNDSGTSSPVTHPSTVALNLLGNSNNNNRPFHSISSGKHALPQSVFTIDVDSPWSVRAANDLACLMFGVSKSMIKSLTLMDLIAPQFREFVTDRITRSGISKLQRILPNTDIIFAGEIVAISRPGDKGFAWTSLWAKRKGNLIIFMFDQIPCDAFNLVVLRNDHNDFDIASKQVVAGSLLSDEKLASLTELSSISKSMNAYLQDVIETHKNEDIELSYTISEQLNVRRYFTIQMNDENVPCAVTSNALEIHPGKVELKLKLHSLPYIAGIFVINAQDFKIISCNNAIARNLFGRSSIDLTGKSMNELIVNFYEIFKIGLKEYNKEHPVVPGLVLPEHFFRYYNALLTSKLNGFEENFTKSKGLIGKHVDGQQFHIDVQLRVSALDTYVLWITYSRQDNNVTDSILLEDESKSLLKPHFKRTRLSSGETSSVKAFTRLPSQLQLLGSEVALPDIDGGITRHNSTRNPNKFGHQLLSSSSYDRESQQGTIDSSVVSDLGLSRINSVNESLVNDKEVSFTEADLLEQENAELELKIRSCKSWPHEIGEKRRVKKIVDFKVLGNMGEGAYGKVILAQHIQEENYEIIVKCIDKERILVDTWVRDRKLGTIPSEIQIMSTLMKELHPNIMRIVDFFEDEQYYYLETPIFGNPPAIDLFDYIEVKSDMTELECQFIFKQIASAIFHLHKHGIIHRDIKDENVIVDERGIIKLIDFGSAGYTKLGPFDVFVGTIDYASPEVLNGEKYEGRPQDIWALGILLYTILYKENPFYNVDEIMEGDLRLPNVITPSAQDLIKTILVRDVDKRPTITDILEHDWLQ